MFCTNNKERYNENVIEPGLSDYFLVSVSLPNVKSMNSSVPQKEVRLYYKTNLNGFQKGMHELHQLVVNEINEGLDINTVWNTFRDGMWQNVNKFVPVQQRRVKSPHEPPWFNISARKACNKQRKLYCVLKRLAVHTTSHYTGHYVGITKNFFVK